MTSSPTRQMNSSTAVFIAVWLALALAFELTGHDRGLLRLATCTVAQPLWFVGVYLGVVALAPAMLRLHRRLGAALGIQGPDAPRPICDCDLQDVGDERVGRFLQALALDIAEALEPEPDPPVTLGNPK